jgi:hypothetical protein
MILNLSDKRQNTSFGPKANLHPTDNFFSRKRQTVILSVENLCEKYIGKNEHENGDFQKGTPLISTFTKIPSPLDAFSASTLIQGDREERFSES